MDTKNRKLKKSLAAASSKGIRYVLLIGENEARVGKVVLKNMIDFTEITGSLEDAVSIVLCK